MKKTLSLILALLMTVSCASGILADDTAIADEVAVIDVAEVEAEVEAPSAYTEALTYLNSYKILVGNEAGDLMADKALERYEMALLMGRIMTGWVDNSKWEDDIANDSQFSDLKGSKAEAFYGAMSYVNQKGVICGYPDGSFKPEQVVTYREALTMAVRALGYKPANWPWDYIEKAVELDITKGISDVKYTDPITRGVAAQIVYNTLQADGCKLALASFGTGFGWKDVLVTSSVIEDATTAKYATGVKYGTPAGYVTIQVINEDGTLDDNLYYVQATELGGDAVHGDDVMVGTPYRVLLANDAKDKYVEVISATKVEPTTYTNNGVTDDKGEAITGEIKDYVATKKLVSKYNKNLLADKNHADLYKEIIVVTTGTEKLTEFNYNKNPYAFDWTTGDILVKVKKDDKYITLNDKGELVDLDGKKFATDADGNAYKVAWYYDATSGYYFKNVYEEVKVAGKTEYQVVGIDKLDPTDVEAIKAEITKQITVEKDGDPIYTVMDKISAPLYAKLDVYTTTAGEYAVYEAYSYGKVSQDKVKCGDCDKEQAAIVLGSTKVVLDSADCAHRDGAWWQDEYAPELNADGKIVAKWCIYGYNPVTKEVKIIKTIEDKTKTTDVDTYYATGILRGYSLNKGEVVIGDETLKLNQNFGTFNKNRTDDDYKDGAWKAHLTIELDGLFNQFVRYYVLDGAVVEIEIAASKDFYIVVESYAGINKDGYVVVNGYSTDDLTLTQFKVAVFDKWNEGDIFWYGMENDAAKYFAKSGVYNVVSYDKENDLYFVDLLGEAEYDPLGEMYGFDYTGVVTGDKKGVVLGCESGYRTYTAGTTSKIKKVDSSDKYVFIQNSTEATYNYMPIITYTGKMANGWTATGDVLVGAHDAGLIIMVNTTAINGFNLDQEYFNAALVMCLSNKVLDKYFDVDLNGATTYGDILTFNFVTGEAEYSANSLNKKPSTGSIYRTVNHTIVSEFGDADSKWADIWGELVDVNTLADTTNAGTLAASLKTSNGFKYYDGTKYKLVNNVEILKKYIPGCDDDYKDNLSVDVVAPIFNVLVGGKGVKGLVADVKAFVVVEDANGVVTNFKTLNKDSYKSLITSADISKIVADVVLEYTSSGWNAVIYVVPSKCNTTTTTDAAATTVTQVVELEDGAYITVNAENETKTVVDAEGNETKTFTVTSLGFEYVGSLITGSNHNTIASKGYIFDFMPRCATSGADSWNTTIAVGSAAATPVYDLDITYVPYAYGAGCVTDAEKAACECDLMKAFEFDTAIVITATKAAGDTTYTFNGPSSVKVTADFGGDGTPTVLDLGFALDASDNLIIGIASSSAGLPTGATFVAASAMN